MRVAPAPGEKFTPEDDLQGNVGQTINVHIDGSDHVGQGTIVAVHMAPDSTYAELTIDVPGLASNGIDLGAFTVSTKDGPELSAVAEETL